MSPHSIPMRNRIHFARAGSRFFILWGSAPSRFARDSPAAESDRPARHAFGARPARRRGGRDVALRRDGVSSNLLNSPRAMSGVFGFPPRPSAPPRAEHAAPKVRARAVAFGSGGGSRES